MSPWVLLTIYCILILVASLAGGWIPQLFRLTHTRLQVATSFVAGLMLGVGVLHLLPHAWYQIKSIDRAASWLLGGFLGMFLIQRFFHFHHHDVPDEAPEGVEETADHDTGHERNPGRAHPEPHAHDHTLAHKSARHLSWTGAAFGLTLHTLIDGFAVAASVEVESNGGEHRGLLGLGTFLVVVLHKPFDAMAIATLMTASGWSRSSRHLVNGLFALAIPTGMLLFEFGQGQFSGAGTIFLGSALAFAAGTFICIAASDLLPELQFHAHDRVKLSVALLAGLLLAAVIGKFETSGHDRHEVPKQSQSSPDA
jgi:zinc and cadmium transporter